MIFENFLQYIQIHIFLLKNYDKNSPGTSGSSLLGFVSLSSSISLIPNPDIRLGILDISSNLQPKKYLVRNVSLSYITGRGRNTRNLRARGLAINKARGCTGPHAAPPRPEVFRQVVQRARREF